MDGDVSGVLDRKAHRGVYAKFGKTLVGTVGPDVLGKLTAHEAIKQAKPLVFNVD